MVSAAYLACEIVLTNDRTMFLLTQFGMPEPWSVEEVQAWLAKVKQELNAGYRIYQVYTRVWGQKPADA